MAKKLTPEELRTFDRYAPPQPFLDVASDHVPFRLTRRISRSRPYWQWLLTGVLLGMLSGSSWAVFR